MPYSLEMQNHSKSCVAEERDIGSTASCIGDKDHNYPDGRLEISPRFPWLGLGSILCVWVAAGAAVAVLLVSDGKPQSRWPDGITPSVILAGINAFSNVMLAIAIGQGVAIAWWRKLQKGASVEALHHSWGFSTSVVSLVKGWKYLNFIALATVAAKLAIVDGILLQRATKTYQDLNPTSNITMQVPNTTDFPTTGIVNSNGVVTFIDPTFQTSIVNDWAGSKGGLSAQYLQNCDGICVGTFQGIGLSYDCSSPVSERIDLNSAQNQNATSVAVFSADFEMSWANATKDYASIFVNMLMYNADDMTSDQCVGSIRRQTCEMKPAIVDIEFNKQIFTDRFSSSIIVNVGQPGDYDNGADAEWNSAGDNLHGITVKRLLPIVEKGEDGNSKLGGVFLALQQYIGSTVNITYDQASKQWQKAQLGTFASTAASIDSTPNTTLGTCNYRFSNNSNLLVVESANSMLLAMTSNIDISPDAEMVGIIAQQQSLGIYFRTNRRFMIGAVVSMIVCAFLVLPAYWAFWELARPVTLAPIEIAGAFRAPVLESGNQTVTARTPDELLKEIGQRRIMYGELEEQRGRLAVDEIGKVKRFDTE